MNRSEFPQFFLNFRLVGWVPLIVIFCMLIGWPCCGVLALLRPGEFAFGYLTILSFFATLSLGALFWILLHHAVDAAWSVLLRRIWEHLACLLLPLLILSIPLVCVHWQVLLQKMPPHWFSPSIQWLLLWGTLLVLVISACWLRRVSIRDDDHGGEGGALRRLAFASIPCFAVGFALISILAWMSLQGGWISTIWPIYIFTGAALSSFALTIFIVIWLLPSFNGNIKADHFHLFGKLLFALTLFWAYIAFGQYLIIWYGNLPEEGSFFRVRSEGFAWVAGWVLVIGHFLIPFLLLLPRAAKKQPKFLAGVAAWLVLMQFVEMGWIILPTAATPHFLFVTMSLLASFVAIGGTLMFIFFIKLSQSPLWPVSDSRLEECLSLIDE